MQVKRLWKNLLTSLADETIQGVTVEQTVSFIRRQKDERRHAL